MRKFKRYFMLSTIVCLAIMLMPCHAGAKLISVDDAIWGVDSVTRDTDTCLEWLDLSATLGMSFNEVSAQLGHGGNYAGWRYATIADFVILLDNAGISGFYDVSEPNYEPTVALLELMGSPVTEDGSFFALLEEPTPEVIAFMVEYVLIGGVCGTSKGGVLTRGDTDKDWGSGVDLLGSHLVREVSPVPEPTTLLLLGSGLFGLAVDRKRKKSKVVQYNQTSKAG